MVPLRARSGAVAGGRASASLRSLVPLPPVVAPTLRPRRRPSPCRRRTGRGGQRGERLERLEEPGGDRRIVAAPINVRRRADRLMPEQLADVIGWHAGPEEGR